MSRPKEGSRDTRDGIIVSMVPDVCLTPQGDLMMPVPYTIWCRQADAANLANSVRQTDDRSHAVASLVVSCHGDEPGTGGGVFSGTMGAECTPKTWSETVRAEGRNMVRHTDEWWMNHGNTYGQLTYVKDAERYQAQPLQNIVARISRTAAEDSALESSQISQAQQASPKFRHNYYDNHPEYSSDKVDNNLRISILSFANDNGCGLIGSFELTVDGEYLTHCSYRCGGAKPFTFLHQYYGSKACPGNAPP